MRKNHFNNFNNDRANQNNNEDEDSLNGNSAQISNIESNKNIKPENNDNNLYENKNTQTNRANNTIHPANNVDNTQNSSNNNNNNSSSLSSTIFILIQQILLSLLSPPNSNINNSFSSRSHDHPIPNNEDFDDRGFNYLPSYFNDNLDNENEHNSLDDLTFDPPNLIIDSPVFNYNYDLRPINSFSNDLFEDIGIDSTFPSNQSSKSSEQNHQGNTFLSRKRKRGRLSKKLKEQNDGIKRHSREEKGNVIRKMIIALKKYAHKFIKGFTHAKLYEPTITECIKGSKAEIRKFLNLKLFDVYSYHTIPKNFKGVQSLKFIQDPEFKRKEKKNLLKGYQISITNKINDEKDKKIKPLTALLDLTFLDFLNIYLDYGYNGNNNRTIKIDENKYGFKFIYLQGFPTYYETKHQFSLKESNQTNYRKSLKDIIAGK